MIEREGHEHFTLPEEHEWRRRFILTEYDKVLGLLTRTTDEVRRMRNEVYTHDIDPGRLETPYSDWVGRLVSTVVQNHGNLGIYLSKMVDMAAGVDVVLEDERRAGERARQPIERRTPVVDPEALSDDEREMYEQIHSPEGQRAIEEAGRRYVPEGLTRDDLALYDHVTRAGVEGVRIANLPDEFGTRAARWRSLDRLREHGYVSLVGDGRGAKWVAQDDKHDLETLRRLVNDLRKRPTSRPARDQLFGELNRQLTRDTRKS